MGGGGGETLLEYYNILYGNSIFDGHLWPIFDGQWKLLVTYYRHLFINPESIIYWWGTKNWPRIFLSLNFDKREKRRTW